MTEVRDHGRWCGRLGKFLCGLGVLIAACGAVVVSAEANREVVRFGLASPVVTLDPRFATDATSSRLNRLLYRALVDFDEQFTPVPSLAAWRQISDKRYRFSLDVNRAPFVDGSRLTAVDVHATYTSVLDAATGSPHRGSLSVIETIRVIDKDTVEFQLKRAEPLFPSFLSVGIMPAKLLNERHEFTRQPVGNGAFALKRWSNANVLEIIRRSDGLAVQFTRLPDPTVRALKLARGEVDLIQGNLPPELLGWLGRREDLAVKVVGGTNIAYLGFNLEDESTGRIEVRKAIAHAIDRKAIIAHLLGGRARPASALLVSRHWAGNPELPLLEYDPDRARRYLAQVGHGPKRPLVLTYKTSSDPFRLRLATVIQHQLAQIGIELKLKSYDWGTFYGDVKAGRFQLYSLAWIGIKSPDIFRYTLHSSAVPPVGANRGRLRDETVDRLIEAAERGTSRAVQVESYRALQAVLLRTLPIVPLWFEDQTIVHRKVLSGYTLSQDGNYDGLRSVRLLEE